jgi:hypothetical protein
MLNGKDPSPPTAFLLVAQIRLEGSLSAVATMSILLWRWLVKLCFLQTAAIAFAPSILRLSRHRHHQQESSSSSSASISVTSRTRRFPAFVLTTSGLLEPRRDLRTILGTRTEAVDEYVEAEDLDGLQELFNRYCDQEGLMTKSATKQIPAIAELLVGVEGIASSPCIK